METRLHFRLVSDTFQRTETPLQAVGEMPQETEADPLTWVPEDEAGKNHHVKFSLHFPLNDCSCFAWRKKKISQIREAKTRKEMCLHGGGKSQWRALPPIELFGGSFTPVVLFCFLRKKGLWLPLFFLCRKYSSLQEQNKTCKFSSAIPVAHDYVSSRRKKGIVILGNWMFLHSVSSGDVILLNKQKSCNLWESAVSDTKT